jgi:hypothetical protein
MAGTHPDTQNRAPHRFSFASEKHRSPYDLKVVAEKHYRDNDRARDVAALPVEA